MTTLAQALVLRTGDAEPVLDPDAVVEARALLALVTGAAADPGQAPDIEALHAVGWLHWLRGQELPVAEMRDEVQLAAVSVRRQVLGGAQAGARTAGQR